MKLLDWMLCKFKNEEPLKEFATGNPCTCLMGQPSLDDLEYYPKATYYAKPSTKARENHVVKSSSCITADYDEHMGQESSAALPEAFPGFLAIGTLGIDSDPETPKFGTSYNYFMEKETQATENEVQFINDELEKVLGAEGKEDDSSGNTLEAAVGLPETTSLGELFQKAKVEEENGGVKCNKVEKQKENKDTDNKSAVHLMKKILKGRKASGGSTIDKKVHKILHLFHRKNHPETTTNSQNQSKRRNQMLSGEDINSTIFPEREITKKGANNTRSNMPRGVALVPVSFHSVCVALTLCM